MRGAEALRRGARSGKLGPIVDWAPGHWPKFPSDRAIRFGTDPDVSLNGSMAAEDRVDVLTKLIDALEKSFPVTNLTGAMKSKVV